MEKFRTASTSQSFRESPNLLKYFFRWRDWANPEEVRQWVSRQLIASKDAAWLDGVCGHAGGVEGDVSCITPVCTIPNLFTWLLKLIIDDATDKWAFKRDRPLGRVSTRKKVFVPYFYFIGVDSLLVLRKNWADLEEERLTPPPGNNS